MITELDIFNQIAEGAADTFVHFRENMFPHSMLAYPRTCHEIHRKSIQLYAVRRICCTRYAYINLIHQHAQSRARAMTNTGRACLPVVIRGASQEPRVLSSFSLFLSSTLFFRAHPPIRTFAAARSETWHTAARLGETDGLGGSEGRLTRNNVHYTYSLYAAILILLSTGCSTTRDLNAYDFNCDGFF